MNQYLEGVHDVVKAVHLHLRNVAMLRLSGSDAGFLNFEEPKHPYLASMTMELAPPRTEDGEEPLDLDRLREHIAKRVLHIPPLRWKIKRTPFGLDHPVWVEVPELDLEYHVQHATIADPKDDDLDRFLSDTQDPIFDRSRPLWRVTLIDGLKSGSQALLFQFQHSMFDGQTAMRTAFDLVGDNGSATSPAQVEATPVGALRLIISGVGRQARLWWSMPSLVILTSRRLKRAGAVRKGLGFEVPRMTKDTPACQINNSSSDRKAQSHLSISLGEMNKVKRAAGVTFDDVVLSMCAGGLRQYLARRGDLPVRPLTAMVPVSLDSQDAPARSWGNSIARIVTSLATDIEDPWERLKAISTVRQGAADLLQAAGPDTMSMWTEYMVPAMAVPLARLTTRLNGKRQKKAFFNLVASTVMTPARSVSFGGRPITSIRAPGTLSDSVGLMITTVVFNKEVLVSIRSDPESLSSPHELAEDISRSAAELMDLARSMRKEIG
jgi:WS/DGAT/MGAT family acyltransferase